MKIIEIANDIKQVLYQKQKEFGLEFFEEEHKYLMKDIDGNLRGDFPSVSKVLKNFYNEFPTEQAAYNKAGGDPQKQEELIAEWAAAGDYATNLGSRTHYILEKKSIDIFGLNKEVRQPIFNCDIIQTMKSDSMVNAGIKFLNLMKSRGAILIDTEMVLGSPELSFVGQPDKIWIMENKEKTGFILLITDYKTNKPKNFISNKFTKKMKEPFIYLDDTSLSHYYLQLPLYGKLLVNMLKETKYEDLKFVGGVVVLLKEDSEFTEYKIPKNVVNDVLELDISKYIKK